MPQLPLLSGKQVVRALSGLGYQVVRQTGSHMRLACPGRKSVTVPDYKTIDRSLLARILREARITTDEFCGLL
jgi:predicted RNA binding protein YcfA (HicA-like mRNA interferase family)